MLFECKAHQFKCDCCCCFVLFYLLLVLGIFLLAVLLLMLIECRAHQFKCVWCCCYLYKASDVGLCTVGLRSNPSMNHCESVSRNARRTNMVAMLFSLRGAVLFYLTIYQAIIRQVSKQN